MRVLIISDTHGRRANLEEVLEREESLDMLIHLGDVEDDDDYIEAVVDYPPHIIAGNNDYFSFLSKEKEIKIGKYKVWITHGHNYYVSMDTKRLRQEAVARGVDIVMFGHTHKPYIDVGGDLMVINPGSLSYPRQDGRKPTYIIMETDVNGNANFQLHYV